MIRKLSAEVLGTGLLVYLAVGVATLSFGFGATGLGTDGWGAASHIHISAGGAFWSRWWPGSP